MLSVFTKQKNLLAPVSGRTVPFGSVPYFREAARRGLTGMAFIPADTRIYAPIDGVVRERAGSSINAEIYADPARNTIELRGGFSGHIKKGSRVHAGDLIATIDTDFIQQNGCFTYVLLLLPKLSAIQIDNEWVRGGVTNVMKTR